MALRLAVLAALYPAAGPVVYSVAELGLLLALLVLRVVLLPLLALQVQVLRVLLVPLPRLPLLVLVPLPLRRLVDS